MPNASLPVPHCVAFRLFALGSLLTLALALPATAQVTQPVWYPPYSLYGRPVSQPFFDFPNWARYSNCRPAPLAWGYDPFPNYGPCDCTGQDYPTVNCPGDFVAHRASNWYGMAEFAPMTIDHLDGHAIARVGPTGPVVLSTEDLQQEFSAGGKYTIGRRIFDCYRVEGTYMGFNTWDDARVVTNNEANSLGGIGNLSTFLSGFSNPITAGLDGNDTVSASIRSSFQSGEINVRYWADMPPGPFDVSYLVGARCMRITEQFSFLGNAGAPTPTANDFQSNTTNDMWGVQIGIQGCFLVTTRWWVDFDLKGAILNDRTDLSSSFIQNGIPATPQADTRDRTVWLGDISLVANWQMTPYLTFRAGYQALFFNGLSLAQDQVRSPLVNNAPGPFSDSGRLAIHGPVIGLMGMW